VTLALTAAGRSLEEPTAGTVEHAVERLLRTTDVQQVLATTALLSKLIARLEGTAT
jgi:hypothetical protein